MPADWYTGHSPSIYSTFRRIVPAEAWFEAYEITPTLFAFYEPRHYENTIIYLVIGRDRAALIDTGCGIGDLRALVETVTDKPIVVINTHTHTDHLGSNARFSEIMMFDHPLARRASEHGVSHATVQTDLLAEGLIAGPLPDAFDPATCAIPPFKVSRWLKDGDTIDLGDRALEVIHTPGEAPDHISLLDRAHRLLFCGDILLHGSVWSHLDGGSVEDLLASYRKLMAHIDAFDHLLPGHNEPWLDKSLLPESLAGAEKIVSGQAAYERDIDFWGRHLRRYSFGRFSILTQDQEP